MQKTLGGDRLGSGKKMKVELHGYERSTHDLGYVWRSTMAAGTLVPFMVEIALPGDTFDINLQCNAKTHPTLGPLFGSYKIQLDVFQAPIRLYNALLHNNALNIGMNMAVVKFPIVLMSAPPDTDTDDLNNSQVNPSSIMAYLGLRGIGQNSEVTTQTRAINAMPLLAYWDIYKNYYANKQEEIGAVIHTPLFTNNETVDDIEVFNTVGSDSVSLAPAQSPIFLQNQDYIKITYTGTAPFPDYIIFSTTQGDLQANEIIRGSFQDDGAGIMLAPYNATRWGNLTLFNWRYRAQNDLSQAKPTVTTFALDNIDDMRNAILQAPSTNAFNIATPNLEPYIWIPQVSGTEQYANIMSSQEGLGLKTYQSDLFNNWLQTEWIDGAGGITEVTSIDTTGGSFSIDTLNLAKKVYDMLNRIAVSGGTYDDWLDAVYTHDRYTRCETPMYMGGLIKELIFEEVVSNSQSTDQPLGTLAGKGIMANKHKGGHVTIKVDEPSYIMGIISLTPRIDYSQGNKWHIHLTNMDDLHKPALDEIGFQELITEQMAWWDTEYQAGNWVQRSAGKQPAWINYMTNVNQTYGNFAIPNNEMFMTLNRRYEPDAGNPKHIADLTTYIDPSKFNFIFAETALDAQNFWMQIAVDITARRKMSAKIMPNL